MTQKAAPNVEPSQGMHWTPGEAAAVNDFLSSPIGRKWLSVLNSRKPKLDLTGVENAALTGSFIAGYDRVFVEIQSTRMTFQSDSASARAIDPTRD